MKAGVGAGVAMLGAPAVVRAQARAEAADWRRSGRTATSTPTTPSASPRRSKQGDRRQRARSRSRPAAQLGFKGPEQLRAVRDGLVPMADILNIQQVGDEPLLGIEGIPFLVGIADGAQGPARNTCGPSSRRSRPRTTRRSSTSCRGRRSTCISSVKAETLDGLKGIKIRVPDKKAQRHDATPLGMAPVLIPWGETMPALASGAVSGVVDLGGVRCRRQVLGVPESLLHDQPRMVSRQIVTINNDAWKKISPANTEGDRRISPEARAGVLGSLDRGRHRQRQAA